MRSRAAAILLLLFLSAPSAHAAEWFRWHWQSLTQPCNGDCSVMIFGGPQVNTGMARIYSKAIPAWNWDYSDGFFLGGSAARKAATLFGVIDIEPEIGIGKRFGNAHETETWAALYFRYTSFPWNHIIYTTIAASTGVNYASGVPRIERIRGGRLQPEGQRLLHYFSPEITFALPDRKNIELVVRFHHRSGGYGVVSKVTGGLQYLTFGTRFHF